MNTVYIILKGGLGNQMFQAALGVALENAADVRVKYITDLFSGDPYKRQFLIENFPALRGRVADASEVAGGVLVREPVGAGARTLRLVDILAAMEGQKKVVLDGYWQNESLFAPWRPQVRDAFRQEPPEAALVTGRGFTETQAIGLHVRRSDYGHHGLARVDYYLSCVRRIREEKGPLPVAIFTDEINFCSFSFRNLENACMVRGNVDDPMSDFYALRSCGHFVISNSTFSWWAAWLGETDQAMIFTPQPWCVFDEFIAPAPDRWNAVADAVMRP